MRKIVSLILLLTIGHLSYSQEIKFLDTDGQVISKEQFLKKKDLKVNIALSFQVGRRIETRLFPRENFGRLSADGVKTIRETIEKSTSKRIPAHNIMIVNYYPGYNACSASGNGDEAWLRQRFQAYLRKVTGIKNTSQAFICANKEGLQRYDGIINWFPDLDFKVKNTFFKYPYPCGSFVIIKPSGEFYAYFGEYSHDLVIKQAKKMAKKTNKKAPTFQ